MKNKIAVSVFILAVCLTSCRFGKETPKNVDPFYTWRRMGQQIVYTPLVKPIELSYDLDNHIWLLEGYNDIGNVTITTNDPKDLSEIGLQGQYVYGKVSGFENIHKNIEPDDYVYAKTSGIMTFSKELRPDTDSSIRLHPIEGTEDSYITPDRYFVISAKDRETKAFFDKAEYLYYLKQKGVEGKMYNSDSLRKVFWDTGVLDYFPDSVKVKLQSN